MRAKRVAGWPVQKALDGRFAWLARHTESLLGSMPGRPPVHDRLDTIETVERQLGGHLGTIQDRVDTLAQGLEHDRAGLDAALVVVAENTRILSESISAVDPGYQIPPIENRVAASLSWTAAEFLNWASGANGYLAQTGLWFNNPVHVAYESSGPKVRGVNERIVENVFVPRALAGLDKDARILDVGGSESTMGLSLASLGYRVTVVDPRGYELAHPNLTVLEARYDELPDEHRGFDAAVVLSAVEHFGLGHYGFDEPGHGSADVETLRDLRERLAPGGRLVLTAPFGIAKVDAFQRVYDEAGIDDLLSGWHVAERHHYWQDDDMSWRPGTADQTKGRPGVVLLVAHAPGE